MPLNLEDDKIVRIAAVLVSAHAVADFALQTRTIYQRKSNPLVLALHALIHGAVSYLFLQSWNLWQLPLLLFLSHALIDGAKLRLSDDGAPGFLLDQAAHLAAIALLLRLALDIGWIAAFDGRAYRAIVLLGGLVLTVRAAGFLIGKVSTRITRENRLELDGLRNGGMLIGQLERLLVFLLVLIGQPMAIGFLVAAKSILRFPVAEHRKMAEYVLIGTLMSFTAAIVLALLTSWALSR